MTTTKVYGYWYDFTGYNTTVEGDVATFVAAYSDEWRERIVAEGHFAKMVEAYREAINDALPKGVCLAGNVIYGPARDADKYSRRDIAEIIDSVDLGAIVEKYDPDND